MQAVELRADLGVRIVNAAKAWMRSSEFVRSERALFALQGCFPAFDEDVSLLKVVALQALDSSRAMCVARWAAHVARVLNGVDPRSVGVELVDELAAVPGASAAERKRALTIASRFAHYFVDVDRFPVIERWTEAELARFAPATERGARYVDFAERLARVASELAIARPRHLASYLWLAGQRRAWERNPRTPIHRAARAWFERAENEALVVGTDEQRAAA